MLLFVKCFDHHDEAVECLLLLFSIISNVHLQFSVCVVVALVENEGTLNDVF